ncbi:hypothetical protein DVH24_004698 [Malus domestica]|uniref:Uncharacterized protein n=1 Tax=Malus domestica TaxID=3750 RepID=A0A498IF32_MALDO|nr:hypothetical protein DVH24_004698 [Malus domestica]
MGQGSRHKQAQNTRVLCKWTKGNLRPIKARVRSLGHPSGAGCKDPPELVDDTASSGVPWLVQAVGSLENQNWTTEVKNSTLYGAEGGGADDGASNAPFQFWACCLEGRGWVGFVKLTQAAGLVLEACTV